MTPENSRSQEDIRIVVGGQSRATHRLKHILGFTWLALFIVGAWNWVESGLEFSDTPELLNTWLREFGLKRAAVIYIVIFAIRPLVLFPAALLVMASGLVFGPWMGMFLTVIAENASANIAFLLARYFGREWIGDHEHGAILNWEEKVRQNAILAVLVTRLVYLPFDAVNFGCGLTSMRHRDFFIGTFIGIIPGLVTFVLLGGSVSANVDDRLLIIGSALLFFVLGLGISRLLKQRESGQDQPVAASSPLEARPSKEPVLDEPPPVRAE